MDSVGLQLPPVMPESFFDLASHTPSYTPYPPGQTSLWAPREDGRAFQPHGTEFDPHLRSSGIIPRRSALLGNGQEGQVDSSVWAEEEEEDVKDVKAPPEQGGQKQSQVAATLAWLSENYERAEGVCLPRCVLYQHYLDFCKKMKFTPAGAATFGKIIRQRFPKLTTRRLGTRGQSKYHYYGIGIKETSIYYQSVYSGKGLTRFSGIKIKTEGSNRKYSLSSKTGTLLPEFPHADNLILPDGVDKEKMATFILMYRTHCQRILDTIISANFEEVQNFLVHFWQGMPEHLVEILKSEVVADVVGLCDSILYKVLVDVLIPPSIQDLPDSLYSDMKMFAKRLPRWIDTSMESVTERLRERKLEVVKGFMQSLRRQTSFVQVAQTARTVLQNNDSMALMMADVADVDFVEICSQAGFMEPTASARIGSRLYEFYDGFQSLLSKQAPVEAYTEWLDNIIDKCVLQPCQEQKSKFKDKAAEFLLQWGAFGALLERDLTLRSAQSFGSFHLIRIMFDEYVFLVMETQHELEAEKELQARVRKHMKNAEEIQTQAKVRNTGGKSQLLSKGKKRKHGEDYDSSEEISPLRNPDENRPSEAAECNQLNGTAFSRPNPSLRETAFSLGEEANRSSLTQSNLPLSPLKHYQTYNGGPYDRPTYIPQFGLTSYSDYVGTNSTLGGTRIPNYSESHSQPFGSVHLSSNISPVNGNYWHGENRGHHTLSDTYSPYSYNKLASSYDTYNKGSIFRNNSYSDPLNRSAFDTSRAYYRSAHENLQVGTPLSVAPYSGNFMDIAPSAQQYCRQEGVIYQDDLYPVSMTASLGKSYWSAPFR